jgi:hypothetical protein
MTRSRAVAVVLIAAWTILMTRFTVNGYAGSANADVLMSSIMSLQNLTVYYWGQNRLLNVLPALAYPFRDPHQNLQAILYITAASYFAFLISISALSAKLFPNRSQPWRTLSIYAAVSAFSPSLPTSSETR